MGAGKQCHHLVQFMQQGATGIPKKCLKLCVDCKEPQKDLIICLSCFHARCGPSHQDHAGSHSSTNNHVLSFSVNLKIFICHVCSLEISFDKCSFKADLKRKLKNLSCRSAPNVVNEHSSDSHTNGKVAVRQPTHNLYGRGIQNIGNTCYLAALMQAISTLRPLQERFGSPNFLAHHQTHREFRILAENLMSKSELSAVHPGQFLKAIAKKHKRFQGKQQQDSHELLRCLLSSLYEEYIDERQQISNNCWKAWPENVIRTFLLNSVPDLEVQALEDMPFDLSSLLIDYPFKPFMELLADYQRLAFEQSVKDLYNGSSQFCNLMQSQSQPVISLVDDIFGGLLHSQITCLRCHQISEIVEPYYDLSLPIDPHFQVRKKRPAKYSRAVSPKPIHISLDVDEDGCVMVTIIPACSEVEEKQYLQTLFRNAVGSLAGECSILDCLKAFFTAEVLEGPDAYDCSRCGQHSSCSKKYSIKKAPQVLVLHLKRFQSEGRRFSKQNKRIHFPLDLCLNEFMRFPEDGDLKYSLSACVVHQGGLAGGHYISYRRNTEDHPEWLYFSDSHCSPTSSKSVLTQQAYLLVYERY